MKSYVRIRKDREDAARAVLAAADYGFSTCRTGEQVMLVTAEAGPLGVGVRAMAGFRALSDADVLMPVDEPIYLGRLSFASGEPSWDGFIGSMG